MNFVSYSQLTRDVVDWSGKLPQDIDAVVGIPRSGMLVASMISLQRNIPLSDPDAFSTGKFKTSIDVSNRLKRFGLDRIKKILVVDDSIWSGGTLRKIVDKLKSMKEYEISYGAMYAIPDSIGKIDYHYKVIPLPRVWEWNLFHHSILKESCVDIDGILCRDPTQQENDDGPRYKQFLGNVKPKIVPTESVAYLVTCRLEKYRKITEDWLRRHGIKYSHLVMMNLPDMQTRQRLGTYGRYKGETYKKTKTKLFIESSARQAAEIRKIARKPVLDAENMRML